MDPIRYIRSLAETRHLTLANVEAKAITGLACTNKFDYKVTMGGGGAIFEYFAWIYSSMGKVDDGIAN